MSTRKVCAVFQAAAAELCRADAVPKLMKEPPQRVRASQAAKNVPAPIIEPAGQVAGQVCLEAEESCTV